jgi:hypothetical protein
MRLKVVNNRNIIIIIIRIRIKKVDVLDFFVRFAKVYLLRVIMSLNYIKLIF